MYTKKYIFLYIYYIISYIMNIKDLNLKEIMKKEKKDTKIPITFRIKRFELEWIKASAKMYGITPSFFLEKIFSIIHKQQIEKEKKGKK